LATQFPFAIPSNLLAKLPAPGMDGITRAVAIVENAGQGVLAIKADLCIGVCLYDQIIDYPLPYKASHIEALRPLAAFQDTEIYLPDYFTNWNIKRRDKVIDLRVRAASAKKAVWAWNLRPQRIGEDTFIRYVYEHENFKYGFAWTTPWDEIHRVSDSTGMQEEPEWYDDIKLGQRFKIFVNHWRPMEHIIVDAQFASMNHRVFYLGRIKDRPVYTLKPFYRL
jgi:hypothetical protein